jgi:hypothetical protein
MGLGKSSVGNISLVGIDGVSMSIPHACGGLEPTQWRPGNQGYRCFFGNMCRDHSYIDCAHPAPLLGYPSPFARECVSMNICILSKPFRMDYLTGFPFSIWFSMHFPPSCRNSYEHCIKGANPVVFGNVLYLGNKHIHQILTHRTDRIQTLPHTL